MNVLFYISTIFYIYSIFYTLHILYISNFDLTLTYLFRAVCSWSWELRVIVRQWKTRADAVRRALRSNRIRFNNLICTRPGYEDTIVRKDFLSTGYWIGGCCFLVTLLSSAEGGGDIIDIGRWNLIDLFSQNL